MTHLVIMLAGEARSGKDTSADILQAELEERGYHVTRTYFAKALKESLKKVFNLTDEHVFGSLKETTMTIDISSGALVSGIVEELHHGSLMSIDVYMKQHGSDTQTTARNIALAMLGAMNPYYSGGGTYHVSPRQLMQWWGTEAIREGAYQNAWIDCVKFDIDAENCPGQVAIVSDARFDNEVLAMHEAYPYCWEEMDGGIQVIRTHRGDKVQVTKHASEAGISNELVDFEITNDDTLDALSHKLMEVLDNVIV